MKCRYQSRAQRLLPLLVFLVLCSVGAPPVLAVDSKISLDHIKTDIRDKASLQRGLGLYRNYCLGCHGLSYARYERTANDLEIPLDLASRNLLTADQKIGDLMTTAMPKKKSAEWFGKAPPELSLFARARGADYLYTYLRSFYRDDTRPSGVNNLVYPNVSMPHVLLELQGLYERVEPVKDVHAVSQPNSELRLLSRGSMSVQEYDQAIYDLVNFMVYIAEPAALVRYRMGVYVMLFLLVMLVFTWLLKQEYWRDIH